MIKDIYRSYKLKRRLVRLEDIAPTYTNMINILELALSIHVAKWMLEELETIDIETNYNTVGDLESALHIALLHVNDKYVSNVHNSNTVQLQLVRGLDFYLDNSDRRIDVNEVNKKLMTNYIDLLRKGMLSECDINIFRGRYGIIEKTIFSLISTLMKLY